MYQWANVEEEELRFVEFDTRSKVFLRAIYNTFEGPCFRIGGVTHENHIIHKILVITYGGIFMQLKDFEMVLSNIFLSYYSQTFLH